MNFAYPDISLTSFMISLLSGEISFTVVLPYLDRSVAAFESKNMTQV